MRLQKHAGRLTLRLLDMDAMIGLRAQPKTTQTRRHP